MRKLLLWLVMVAVMIAAILGGTAAFFTAAPGRMPCRRRLSPSVSRPPRAQRLELGHPGAGR